MTPDYVKLKISNRFQKEFDLSISSLMPLIIFSVVRPLCFDTIQCFVYHYENTNPVMAAFSSQHSIFFFRGKKITFFRVRVWPGVDDMMTSLVEPIPASLIPTHTPPLMVKRKGLH